MSQWAKHLLLVAGGLGVIGFFLPFFVYQLDEPLRMVDVSGYRLTVGFDDESLNEDVLYVQTGQLVYGDDPDSEPEVGVTRSLVPLYFIGPAMMLLVAFVSLLRGRLGWLALVSLAGGIVALGGWVREQHYDFISEGSYSGAGAVVLAASGVMAVLTSLAALVWRERGADRGVPAAPHRLPPARALERK